MKECAFLCESPCPKVLEPSLSSCQQFRTVRHMWKILTRTVPHPREIQVSTVPVSTSLDFLILFCFIPFTFKRLWNLPPFTLKTWWLRGQLNYMFCCFILTKLMISYVVSYKSSSVCENLGKVKMKLDEEEIKSIWIMIEWSMCKSPNPWLKLI